MKKKIIFSSILLAMVIALVVAMVFAVSACSSSETAPTNAPIESLSENTVNNTSLESSFDNSSESKISEKSNIESSINSNVSSDSQNSKVENSKKETQNSNSSSKPTETSKSSNTSTNSSSNSKVSSNDSSSKPSSGGSSSGSSSTSSHSHSYSSKTIKATCTSGGYTVHTCSCGASYTDNYTSATGHKWSEWKTVKKATTSSEGRKQRTCSSCGKTESKTIAKVQGSSTSGGHRITGARKAVYSYRGMDSFSSVNLVDLINAERAKEGLCKLEWTADLLRQDYKDTPWMFDSSDLDENGNYDPYKDPEVREPLEGAQKMADMGYATHGNGVGCHCVGSTLHEGDTIEQALRRHIQGYLNSPEHRAILLNAGSHRVTASYAIGSDGTVYTAILIGG